MLSTATPALATAPSSRRLPSQERLVVIEAREGDRAFAAGIGRFVLQGIDQLSVHLADLGDEGQLPQGGSESRVGGRMETQVLLPPAKSLTLPTLPPA